MTLTLSTPTTLSEAALELANKVREIDAVRGSTTVTLEISPCDPLTWLEAQKEGSKIYWATPDGNTEIAGSGVADLVTADRAEELHAFQEHLALEAPYDAWYFGGMRFDGGKGEVDPVWESLRGAAFVRPRVVLVRKGEKASVTCHLMESDDREAVASEVAALSFPEMAKADLRIPEVTQQQWTPDRDQWDERVSSVMEKISSGSIQKQVLARKVDLRLQESLSPFTLLRRMREEAPRCFYFMVSTEPSSAFIGATPELLYTREERAVRCEAVAGTRPSGADETERDRLARLLLGSEKERHEHELVAEYIQEILDGLSEEVSADVEPSVLGRGDWQHLYKQFEAELQPGVTDLQLLQELSPTPAVAAVDVDTVRETEKFDRGWYAGPVGWISRGAAEFSVGIRSALVKENHVTFYAGAGIVEGSVAKEEWAETEVKMGTFLRIFDL